MTDTETEEPSAPAPPPAPTGRKLNVVALWCSEASRERMRAGFLSDVDDDIERVPLADLVVVSTRIPRVRIGRVMARLSEQVEGPIVVACHAGGEAAAVELMELGATSVVAEGNERALANLIEDATPLEVTETDGEVEVEVEANPEALVTTFAQHLDSSASGSATSRGVDPVTGLATSSSFELRIADLAQRSAIPRLGFIRVANPRTTTAELDRETVELLRRRVSMLFVSVTNRYDAELFSLGDFEFAFLAKRLSPKRADELGEQIVTIGESFMPQGHDPLRLGVGHAGNEVASEIRTLRDLAMRATEAAVNEGGGVVGADDLTRSQAGTTELAAALRLAARVDELDSRTNHHSRLVTDYAVEIAGELGYDGPDLIRLRLACQLHDVGKIGLPEDLEEDGEIYRSHAERGARYARISAGPEVAAAIRHHHERWDGAGFPDGLEGEEIPIASRIIAVADAYDRWTAADGLSMDEVADRLREEANLAFDESVVEAALNLFA